MNRLMWASAASASCNENHISFTCLLLHHIPFLRRIKAWMEVEEHTIARCCRAIGGIGNCCCSWSALYNLNMALRSSSKSCTWRLAPINFRSLGPGRVIVGFEGILVVLMLLLSGWMISIRRLGDNAPLLNLILIRSRREPISCLLLSLNLSVASLSSCIRISSSSCSVHIYLVLNSSAKVLLSLVHHMMMLNLVSC